MESDKHLYIVTILICVLSITLTYIIIDSVTPCKNIQGFVNTIALYNISNKNMTYTATNGLYQTPNYYCVWTANRSKEEILKTDAHEQCHDLVYKDYDHFCKVFYQEPQNI